ncbi:PadR family transcriptional regulator [Micromonospora pisi]|uniref:PadR family transcriptional regulator n=1 Tax=Micromonospora pisi TaxID=589240 RepID=A0A495JUC9_9ACTN|nr:PadR family transcriptional regulator [Micromonospora pisi]RKR92148.1 PadR family transcriptional regulator [Micromonospora pisi]
MAALREPTFLILAALAVRPLHGYGVIQEVTTLSEGRVTLQAGTLYAALDRLTAEGLVEPDREETVDGRQRRYYRLTEDGVRALDSDLARQLRNTAAAGERLRQRRSRIAPHPAHPPMLGGPATQPS